MGHGLFWSNTAREWNTKFERLNKATVSTGQRFDFVRWPLYRSMTSHPSEHQPGKHITGQFTSPPRKKSFFFSPGFSPGATIPEAQFQRRPAKPRQARPAKLVKARLCCQWRDCCRRYRASYSPQNAAAFLLSDRTFKFTMLVRTCLQNVTFSNICTNNHKIHVCGPGSFHHAC